MKPQKTGTYAVAAYSRLSREDGDRMESDSIINQQRVIEDFCALHSELNIVEHYADDGYTGTNFERPGFQRMLADLEAGRTNCVIVKDLSRFGRDYIDMGYYLERIFPALGVRFIAINDAVDSEKGPYDMLLPLKNVFNAQYAKDISDKVRSAFSVKQKRLSAALERVRRLKQGAYEDYRDKLLDRDEFLRYKVDYDRQEETLTAQLEQAHLTAKQDERMEKPWIEKLLKLGHLTELDRATLAQTVREIRVFENKRIEIDYLFSNELRGVLEG